MEQLFRDRLREVRTFAGLAVLWARTLADWAVSVPARHWERATPHMHFAFPADPTGDAYSSRVTKREAILQEAILPKKTCCGELLVRYIDPRQR